jgi:hypothetical protein
VCTDRWTDVTLGKPELQHNKIVSELEGQCKGYLLTMVLINNTLIIQIKITAFVNAIMLNRPS